MAGKGKFVMGSGELEEMKKEYRSLKEHWINLKKYNNFGGLNIYSKF